ncbi:hypothetical protein OUZ56_004301 [Daphnia magna]|uniref:Uncharacterized protein n=1 Tax=Daphnia magna TaxID=35525 RepID=A0ABQ9YPC6_9CRUS|nr:hypothetical protein OUZ56_004301 [Daphnia magna]
MSISRFNPHIQRDAGPPLEKFSIHIILCSDPECVYKKKKNVQWYDGNGSKYTDVSTAECGTVFIGEFCVCCSKRLLTFDTGRKLYGRHQRKQVRPIVLFHFDWYIAITF